MEADFWHDMWASGKVGFHQTDINTYLKSHWDQLNLNGQGEILVPLCGKTMDMLWLKQQGHSVIGVELSQQALDQFVSDHQLQSKLLEHDQFCGYQLDDMVLLCGDFFHLSPQDCQNVVAVYDRAALVAFPTEMRLRYAEHLKKVLPEQTPMLLVAMDYDQSLTQGPPFSVTETEVCSLYQDRFDIKVLSSESFSRKNIETTETTYLLSPK